MGLFHVVPFFQKPDNIHSTNILNSSNYKSLFTKSTDPIFIMDLEGQFVLVNKKFTDLLGYSLKEFKKVKEYQIYDDFAEVEYYINLVIQGIPSTYETKLIHKKGHRVSVNTMLIPSFGEDQVDLIFGICRDLTTLTTHENKIRKLHDNLEQSQRITKIKTLENKFIERETQIQSIADRLNAGIWSFDKRSNQITFCSKGVEEIYGISVNQFKEDPLLWNKLIHPDEQNNVEESQQKLSRGEVLYHEYRIINNHGEEKWIQDQTVPTLNSEGKVIRLDGIVQDITKEKEYTETLIYMADHDHLTKLPNGTYFNKQLKEHIIESKKDGKQFAVLSLDLDRFKNINDTLGYEIGNQLLVAISNRLNNILDSDAFLARIGGDSFAICIEGSNKVDDVLPVAKKMIEEMETPFYIDDYEVLVTVSIGISFFPFDGEDSHTLLKNANQALKNVKESGRNDWQIYSSSMNIESFKIFQLERDLRKAIINNEFYLEYQPKVNTRTGRIEGAEALIRWKHPDWGIVSPKEFITLAEENGTILKMSDWVGNEVCALLGKWQQEGLPVVPISINVSPKRLLKADFVNGAQEAIEVAGINPNLIELEITESVVINNLDVAKKVISELKKFGVKFALDDFGTGYSSLSYLMELDIDTLKIDKSFIDGIGLNKKNEGIIKSAIFLAKELEMEVVAEGVEGKEQLNFLLQQECSQIQGYFFSKPVSEKEFKKLLIKGIIEPLSAKGKRIITENRRKYYRLKFDYPLCADMTVIKFKNKDIEIGKSSTLIKDISLGGLKYLSNINLPVQKDIVLQFITRILDEQVQFVGKNVWKLEVDGLFQYGFEFISSDKERDKFASILNRLTIQLKSNPLLPSCDFLIEKIK